MQGQSLLEAIGISTTKSSLEARDNGVCATTSQEPSSPRLYTNVNVDPSVDRLYRHARKHLKRGDEAKAAELLAEAAEQGHAAAHFQLGLLFEEGRGVALDDEAAMRHYRAAADMGHPQGQCNLAVLYEHGRGGLAPSEVMAAPLFRVAADGGDGDAMFNLGVYYEQGRGGLPKSREEAAMWYRKAAAVGDGFGDAKYALAALLLADETDHPTSDNSSSSKDKQKEEEARELLRSAADQGHALSARRLAALTGDKLLATVAARDHTLLPLPNPAEVERIMRHGDVACCKFSFMLGEFMHWAIYDKEAKAFIEFCGRRAKGGGGSGDGNGSSSSSISDIRESTSKDGEASEAVNEESKEIAEQTHLKLGQDHPRSTELRIHEGIHNTASSAVVSSSSPTSGGGRSPSSPNSGRATSTTYSSSSSSRSSNSSNSSSSVVGDEWTIGDAINFSSGDLGGSGGSGGSIPWPSLPGLAGSSARYLWSRGTVPIANAVVQQTPVDDFFKAWEGRDIYKVVWTDKSIAGRGPAAVLEARKRLGEVVGYNPVPRFGEPGDGLNCESFVRQCLDGYARSAQAELVTGDPDSGVCPVM